jgi:hypothetical protein
VTDAYPSRRPAGTLILVSSSPGPTAVRYTPRKNSFAWTVRSPLVPAIVIVESRATISGGRWFVGSFAQTLPPTVPRFRTCTSAIRAATSARIGRTSPTTAEAITSAQATIAPSSSPPSGALSMPLSSPRSPRSTRTSGAASRVFMTLTRVWPPASGRALSCAARRRTASCTEAGRAYSTALSSMGADFILDQEATR